MTLRAPTTGRVSRLPPFARLSGVASLILGAVLVTLTLVTAVAGERGRTEDSLDRGLLSTAQAERQALSNYFARARAVILLTAQNPALSEVYERRGADRREALDRANAALGYLERLYPESIGEACLIDRRGVEDARVVRGVRAEHHELSPDEADNDFFAATFDLPPGRVHQATPYLSPDTGEWVISNSTPLPSRGRAAEAIVHFEVTIESFRRAAASVDRAMDTRIVDASTGRVVIDSARPQRRGTPLGHRADPALVAAVQRTAARGGEALTTVEGERAAIRALPRSAENANDWYVVVSAPRAAAATWRLGGGTFGLLAAGLAFFAAALVSFRTYARALRQAASTDALTHLPNRALLLDRATIAIHQARRNGRQVAALLLDLNRFKEINDTLGHQDGDRLLLEVAKRLADAVRATDTVARLGGDEFVVLAVDLEDAAQALGLADRIGRALDAPVLLSGVEVDVSASIGIALFPAHGTDVDTLLKRADVAMYDAKRARQAYAVYRRELDPHTAERLALVVELRRAIADGELYLDYQPKYEVPSRRLSGVEALARWNHPERGSIPPGEFIPVAENTGLIRPLTDFVLDRAIAQVRIWMDAGLAVPVSVNLSTRSLLDAELPDRVRDVLAKHDVPAELLSLEITESVLLEDPDRAMEVLVALDGMGIRLGIDDFGMGYSSLSYLKRLPVAELKIDRSFVMSMGASSEDAAIVRSTIDLGHNLGLSVVAEGVEDEATLDELVNLRCETVQGFFFARPQSPEHITSLLRSTSCA